MKINLLLLSAVFISFLSFSQCTDDYDWGDLEYGVSPDPEEGETFSNAFINEAYSETIFLLVPENASAIFEGQNTPVDSVILVNIVITQDGNNYTPEEFGLMLTCNNGGTSTNPCTFLGGQSGCGLLSGTPLLPGVFNITLEATVHGVASFGGTDIPLTLPFDYDGYTITVDTEINVEEVNKPLSEVRVSPNPISTRGLIQFDAKQGGRAVFKIFNLLGEEKIHEELTLNSGLNKIPLDASGLDNGVYLYNLEYEGFKVTKRFIVSK